MLSSSLSSTDSHLIAGFAPEKIIDMECDPVEGKRYLVKYQEANLKLCTWETPRKLHKFRPLIEDFH